MPSGPLFPSSAVPDTSGEVFPVVHAANNQYREALGVAGGITADRRWHLEFELPPVLPPGTCKLVLIAVADATSGSAQVHPAWAAINPNGGNAFTATRTGEGTTTLTWSAGEDHDDKQVKIALDAGAMAGGETMVMDLNFEASSWTLVAASAWKAFLIWE